MKTGILLGRTLMLFMFLTVLVSCKDNDPDITIALDKHTLGLNVGETAQLTATVSPSNTRVTWESSNPDVATVDSDGLVTAVDNGTATITAKAGNRYDRCEVTVAEIIITLSKEEVSMWVGQTEQLTATLEPEGFDVTWKTSDPAIATVDENGLVTGVSAGTAIISAVVGSSEAECVFTITIPQVTIWTMGNKATTSGTPQPHIIKIYKDDQFFVDLTDGSANALGESMVSDGDKLYVAGFWGRAATIWTIDMNTKAITKTELTDGSRTAYAKSVFVANGKVYVAGYEVVSSINTPRYWIDGVLQPDLDRGGSTGNAAIYSVFVSGNDVYLGGTNGANAVIWKNGVYSVVQESVSPNAIINALAVDGNDVYAVGTLGTNNARLWKNGVMSVLPSPNNKATPQAIAIYEGDAYITGGQVVEPGTLINKTGGGVWKNSEHLWTLWNGSSSIGSARAIGVVDGDVYVAGYETRGKGQLMVWKNGADLWQLTDFTDFTTNGYGIAVVKK